MNIPKESKMVTVEYTPEIANEILENYNDCNPRKLRKSVAADYARDMINGNWRDCWECITFNTDGKLQNGQHRLLAVMISGTSQKMRTIFGATKITGDTGLKRKKLEEIKIIDGNINEAFQTDKGMAFLNAMHLIYLGIKKPSSSESIELSNAPGIIKCQELVLPMINTSIKGMSRAKLIAGIAGAYLITEDNRLYHFVEVLMSGISTGKMDAPAIAARDRIMGQVVGGVSSGSVKKPSEALLIQSAIRSYLNGSVAKRIYTVDELIYKPTEEMIFGKGID